MTCRSGPRSSALIYLYAGLQAGPPRRTTCSLVPKPTAQRSSSPTSCGRGSQTGSSSCPDQVSGQGHPRGGAPLPRRSALPRPARSLAGPGRGARGDPEARLDPVRPDRGRRPEPRPDAPRAHRRLRARLVRRPLRARRDLRDDEQGAVVHPGERVPLVSRERGPQGPALSYSRTDGERGRRQAGARAHPCRRPALLRRFRAAERCDKELVRATRERRALGARGVHGRRGDRSCPPRREPPLLRPRRAAFPGGATRRGDPRA